MNKSLVAYFSASGITASVAKSLASAIGADLYKISPAVAYTSADLNWRDKHSRSSLEMNDPASRPEIADKNANIDAYDDIFVGFPIWWYTAPAIIRTFLESYDFTGKRVIPFATSGGSGLDKTSDALASSCPGAIICAGRLLNGNPSIDDLKIWAENL